MRRALLVTIGSLMLFSTTACLIGTGNVTSSSADAPGSPRLSQINGELASIEQQLSQLQSDRDLYEAARNEAFMELGKLTGMGPKAPAMSDFMSETLTCDPGMMISMHNANMTAATNAMRETDAKMAALSNQAAALKAERMKIEQSIAASTKSSFTGPGACFTPDTRVALPQGSRSIVAVAPGDSLLVWDEAAGAVTERRVLNTFRGREDHYFLINGDVRVTALHRFLTDSGWVRAKDLAVGARLKTASGWTALVSKKLIEADIEVFNMEVDEHHDFLVVGATESYLVHNTGGGGGGGK